MCLMVSCGVILWHLVIFLCLCDLVQWGKRGRTLLSSLNPQQRAPDLSLDQDLLAQMLTHSTCLPGRRLVQLHLQAERRQCHKMSVASRARERMRHRLNSAPDVVPAHTQARRAEFV